MKNIIIEILKRILHIFFVFPIKRNRIFFSAYSGRQYSCNPKYISQWIINNYPEKYDVIWAFSTDEMIKKMENSGFRCVKFKSLKYIYYLLTSKVVIDNVESWSILPKRAGQYIINTWHGGGAYKGVGLKRKDASETLDKNMLRKNERISIYLSSSKAFSKMTLEDSFGYHGKIIECGMPRNDLLLKKCNNEISHIKAKLNISEDVKIVIYAPTFRHDLQYKYVLDYEETLRALEQKFGGKWIVLMRTHYYIKDEMIHEKCLMDVSDYPDMQELLLISDVLITDYSSSIWDFSLMKKPGFLFMPDYYDYLNERELYTPIEEWPYPACFSMDDLKEKIKNYDDELARIRIENHHAKLRICESGKATEIVGRKICELCH